MAKSRNSIKKLLGVTLLSVWLLVIITNVRAEVYLTPSSYDLDSGTVDSGNIYSVLADDGNTLDIKWAKKNEWWRSRFRYTIDIYFEMENHRYYNIYMSFTSNHNFDVTPPIVILIDIYAIYSDSSSELVGNDVWYGDYSSEWPTYDFDVDSSKYLDKIRIYSRHYHSYSSAFGHYTYFDFVAAVPV